MAENTSSKRGPGRPRDDTKKPKIQRLGIVNRPSDKKYGIEFYYASPSVFKKIFGLYNSESVREVVISFNKSNVVFYASSFSEEMLLQTTVDCAKAHRYYCKSPETIKVSRALMAKVINRIEPKFYDSITFAICNYTSIEVSQLLIILNNPKLNTVSTHTINVSPINNFQPPINIDTTLYPLSFRFSKVDFKKYISDITYIGNELTIIKTKGTSLKFTYGDPVCLRGEDTFDNTIIDLKCATKHKLIAASFNARKLKILANAQLAEYVRFYVDIRKELICQFITDDAISHMITINDIKLVECS